MITYQPAEEAQARCEGANDRIVAPESEVADSTGHGVRMQVATLRRLAVRGAAYIVGSRLIIQLFAWVVTIVTARILRPYDYGILTAAAVLINLGDILAEAGVGKALVQKPEAVGGSDLAGAFTFSLVLSSAMYLVLFGCAGLAARALQTPELALGLRVMGVVFLAIPFRTVPLAMLERRLQLNRLAAIGLWSSILQGCLVLGLALTGWGYWALIVGYMAPKFLEVPILAWQASWLPRLGWPVGRSNPLFVFGMNYTGAKLCWCAYRNADYAIVGRLMGPVALGYYSIAFLLISMPVEKIVATCNQVAFPTFCRLSHDRRRVRDWYLRIAFLLGLLATPALVGLALVAHDAILVVLGAKWTPAALPLRIMSLAGVFMVLGSSIDVLYGAMGRPDINLRFTAISVVVYPLLFYFCGRQWGINGVAAVWAVCYPIMVLLLIGVTRAITGVGVRDVIGSQVRVWASVVFMALVVLAIRYALHDFRVVRVRLGISILAGVVGYVAAIRLLAWESVIGNLKSLWHELRSREVVADAA